MKQENNNTQEQKINGFIQTFKEGANILFAITYKSEGKKYTDVLYGGEVDLSNKTALQTIMTIKKAN